MYHALSVVKVLRFSLFLRVLFYQGLTTIGMHCWPYFIDLYYYQKELYHFGVF